MYTLSSPLALGRPPWYPEVGMWALNETSSRDTGATSSGPASRLYSTIDGMAKGVSSCLVDGADHVDIYFRENGTVEIIQQ